MKISFNAFALSYHINIPLFTHFMLTLGFDLNLIQRSKRNVTQNIGVIGSGSWATAMIKMLSDNEESKQLFWWVRKQDDIDYIKRYKHNPAYLSSVNISVDDRNLSTESREIVLQSDIVILNTPAAYLKNALENVTADDFKHKIIVSAIKGIVPGENLIVGDFLKHTYGVSFDDIVVIGGPCHAEEVAAERLSYLTIASQTTAHAEKIASLLNTHYINTIISPDILGVEYGAVLKNIYALAGGICHGLGFGDNFQAVLVSNAIREMEYFIDRIDSQVRDINQSAYLGDLLVTAYSQFSRNRTFGAMIGKGYSVKSAQVEMNMVAEGYYASACIQEIIRENALNMPICDSVYQILYNNKPALGEIRKLAEKLN